MASRTLTALVVLSACSSAPPQAEPPPTPASTPDAAPTPTDLGEEALRETLERVRAIQDEVAMLRQRPFVHPVEAERQSIDDFRKVMIAEVDKTLSAAKSRATSKALHHLGVLEKKTDLATAMIELAVGQVAAYYNPETGRFYAVAPSEDRAWLEVMTAHELVHGLQDQSFDLRHYVGEPSPAHPKATLYSEDELNARRFVVEGEATFLMWIYRAAKDSGVETATDQVIAQARRIIAAMAAPTWKQMVAQADSMATGADKATRLSALPAFLVAPALESYTRGAVLAFSVHQAGGFTALDALFTDPPESTEQVLHPDDKLIDSRDHPSHVELPNLSNRFGAPLLTETLGELGWRVYLETWSVPGALGAAAGWDGDRLAIYETSDGLVGLLAFVWDSEEDAVEFEAAYRRSVRARVNLGADSSDSIVRYTKSDGSEILVARDGTKLFVVDGARGERADSFMTTLQADAIFTVR